MLNGAIFLPTSTTNAIADHFVFTGLCSVFGFALFFLGHARTYLMFVLVLDRFFTVFVTILVPTKVGQSGPSSLSWSLDLGVCRCFGTSKGCTGLLLS